MKNFSFFCIFFSISTLGFTLVGTQSSIRGWEGDRLLIDLDASKCEVDEKELREDIEIALEVWNDFAPGIILELNPEPKELQDDSVSNADLVFNPPAILCTSTFDSSLEASVPAVTRTKTTNDAMSSALLILNANSGAKARIQNTSRTKRQIILAHEIGHVLGLGHSTEPHALMYFNISKKESLNLSQDDKDGILMLYPRQELIQHGVFGCSTSSSAADGTKSGADHFGNVFIFLFLTLYAFWRLYAKNSSHS